MSDYYKILGVSKNASDDEIKKAFRKLSMKYHPDRPTGDEAKFKEINEAYDTLKDPQKRQQYDYRDSGMGTQFEDMFNSIFGQNTRSARRSYSVPLDLDLAITISLKDLYAGGSKKEVFQRKILCAPCEGVGYSTARCKACNGTGKVVHRGPMISVQSTCRNCMGSGQAAERKNPCAKCSGRGYALEQAKHEFSIPPGAGHLNHTVVLTVEKLGNKVGHMQGNLNLHITIERQNLYAQEGLDLLYSQDVSMTDLCLGGKFKIPLPDNSSIILTLPPGADPYVAHRVRQKGFQRVNRPGRGDLIVGLNLVIPKTLTSDQEKLLKKLKSTGL